MSANDDELKKIIESCRNSVYQSVTKEQLDLVNKEANMVKFQNEVSKKLEEH